MGLESDALDTPAGLHVDSIRMRVLTGCTGSGTGGAANPTAGINTASADPKIDSRRTRAFLAMRRYYHLHRQPEKIGPESRMLERAEENEMRALRAVAVLMVLVATGNSAHTDSIYAGTLAGNQPWTITVDNATVNDKTLFTIFYLGESPRATETGRLGEAVKFDLLSVQANERKVFSPTIPKKTRRIIIEVHAPQFVTVRIEIAQSFSFPVDIVGGASVALEVTWP